MSTRHFSRSSSSSLESFDESFSASILKENSVNFELDESDSLDSNNSQKRQSVSKVRIVDYGPIRVRHRQSPSQTLATGRRSKDEPVSGEDAIKREIRREKNRKAARDLKVSRDQIEFGLIDQLNALESEHVRLLEHQKLLENRKAQLSRTVYNAKQAAFIPFILDTNAPLLYTPDTNPDIAFNLQPLLESIDEHSSTSESSY